MPESQDRTKIVQSVLLAGLVAGILDGADAVIFTKAALGVTPVRLFQYIASGLLGVSAFHGGWHTAFLGICIHFSIAMVAAAIYSIAATMDRRLAETPVYSGAAFGLAVYVVMHYVVLPLTALPNRTIPVTSLEVANLLFSHIFFLGIPIAFITRHVGIARMRRPQLDRST